MTCWLLRAHTHRWKDTRVNKWFIVTEQQCECSAARHLWDPEDMAPIGSNEPHKWRPGLHPYNPENKNGQHQPTSK